MEQIAYGTENAVGFRLDQQILREIAEVGPLLRYERATSIGQNQDQMWLALVTPSPKDSDCFSFKWMMRAGDGDMLWQVLVVGSVSWGPSIT